MLGVAAFAVVVLVEEHAGRVGLDREDEQTVVVAEVHVAVGAPRDGHRVDAAWVGWLGDRVRNYKGGYVEVARDLGVGLGVEEGVFRM